MNYSQNLINNKTKDEKRFRKIIAKRTGFHLELNIPHSFVSDTRVKSFELCDSTLIKSSTLSSRISESFDKEIYDRVRAIKSSFFFDREKQQTIPKGMNST